MQLANITRAGLLDYTTAQLRHFFPDADSDLRSSLNGSLDEALDRTSRCVDAVRLWPSGTFDYLHSTQYCTYLYFLANSLWRSTGDVRVPTKLFLLNKALNGIDCFYEIDLPEIFFIGHSVGIVLAKAQYGNRLVLYQNSTVGKNHGVAPAIGEGVVLYPNSAIIGRCVIGDGTVVSQGTSVINHDTPRRCMVFEGSAGSVVCKPLRRDILAEYFRQ